MKQLQKKPVKGNEIVPFNGKAGLVEEPKGLKSKEHKGLPLITRSEYEKYYGTKSNNDVVATFNFVGYVEEEDGSIQYMDVTAVNGLRGIHVGIDGVRSYRDGMLNPPQGPEDVGEYDMYVTVPPEVQVAEGVMCRFDDCESVESFRKSEAKWSTQEGIQNEIDNCQSDTGWIVSRLRFRPKKDPDVRKRVTVLAMAINDYLKMGGGLDELSSFVSHAVSALMSMTKMPDPKTLLPEGNDARWERFMRDTFGG